jgi:hypothetical protein
MIYKYKRLYNDKTKKLDKHTLNMLINGELHFTRPNEFNDPYDSIMQLDMEYLKQDIITYCQRNGINKIDKYLKLFLNKDVTTNEFPEKTIKNFVEKFSVFCATKTHNNILMWSHYGDHHKGVCIGIKTYENNNRTSILVKDNQFNSINNPDKYTFYPFNPVIYSENRAKKFNIFVKNDTPPEFLFTKHIDWSYEQEVRAVLDTENVISKKTKQNIYLEDDQIAEVIFGSKVPEYIKTKTIKKLKDKKNITFNEMILSNDSYKLKTVELISKPIDIFRIIDYCKNGHGT